MKRTFILLAIILSSCVVFAKQEKYSEVKIYTDRTGLAKIAGLGISADEGVFHKEGYWQTVLSQNDLAKIIRTGGHFEIIRDDYVTYIENRNRDWLKQHKEFKKNRLSFPKSTQVGNYPVPAHFDLGSMGGYFTLDEVMNQLDSMATLYPDLVKLRAPVSSQGTIEGRSIYYVKISKNPNISEGEPRILYNALTHAREPQGMQQLIFYMWYLLENYESNPEVKYLVDNLEMYFIPVMNPDGYEYNRVTAPSGGGSWRKNRRDDGGGNFGVDLNRNWGYQWGYDDMGSSPYPSDETYRGTGPFSEPETQAVREFSEQLHLCESINYHTYGDLFLFPWSYILHYPSDSSTFVNFSDLMTRQDRYAFGVPAELLYTTNGDMNDWMYGEQTSKPKVFSFTPETGTDNDGFWPFPDRIIPLCQETMYQNLMMAHLALKYGETRDIQPAIVSNRQGYFKFQFERYGLLSPGNYSVSITPLDTNQITQTGSMKFILNPPQFQVYTDSIAYTLSPSVTAGTEFKYVISLNNGVYTFRDTVSKYFGPRLVVFQSNCDDFSGWTSPKWNVTNTTYYSPTGSITDSPAGNYSNNTTVSVTTWDQYDLKDSPVAVVDYWAKWNIEKVFDYVEALVSTDNGLHFTPQQGRYTRIGSANQDAGKPVYDWKQQSWVNEEIVLPGYANKWLKFRFTLKSDASTNADGYYFDDFSISIIDMTGVGINEKDKTGLFLSSPIPNPATGLTKVRYHIPENSDGELILTDSRGIPVKDLKIRKGTGEVVLSLENLSSGIYLYRISGEFGVSEVKKLVVVR